MVDTFASGFASGLNNGIAIGGQFLDRQRQAKKDEFSDKEQSRKEKDWANQDEYEASRKKIIDDFNGEPVQSAQAPAINTPRSAANVIASQGIATAQPAPAPVDDAQPVNPVHVASNGIRAPSSEHQIAAPAAQPVPKSQPTLMDAMHLNLQLATLDARHGKGDGAGIANAMNSMKHMEDEGVDKSMMLIGSGNYEGAMQAFNSTGKTKGAQLVGAPITNKPVKFAGIEIPSVTFTVIGGDGKPQTMNTADYFISKMKIEDVIKNAQEGAKIGETSRHNKATEANDKIKLSTGDGSTAEIKNVRFLLQNGLANNPMDAWKMAKAGSTPAGERIISDGAGGVIVIGQDTGTISKIDRRGAEKIMRPGGSAAQPSNAQVVEQQDHAARFVVDPAMKGYKMGKVTPQGVEVLDGAGKLVGHYN